MSIQLFMPTFQVEECLNEIRECLESGWTGIGYKTIEFEKAWSAYTGHPYAHFVHSATAGLHLAVKQLKMKYNWTDEDEIISTPLTFISTNHAILYEKMKVVFADVDEYLCLDPADIERKITPRTKAIMYVGIGGSVGKYEEVVALCQKYDLALILDAAHMAGTRFKGEIPGKEADVVVYSFHAVKNLPMADGGMVCFRDKEDDELCRKLTWLGINKDTFSRTDTKGSYKWKYDVEHVGFKYHGNSIMAGIGLVQLKYLDRDNAYRRQLANWYDEGLAASKIHTVDIPSNCESSRHLYMILVNNRDELLLALNQVGIYPGVHYQDNTAYRMYSDGRGTCPNAHRCSEQLMSLPMHLQMTKADVTYICEQVITYAK
ncbi:DegT/DnrJ/EryC1/StrS family aminotransferase [Priestia taiwanensis]|uniref:Spore coat protein n=1 Tax=Priestia taiwanensis TaxID=1347902 RepID=A0A917ERQ0_9BACI|nr:DegT/DnrJ/EryC1/StrS family aminotransferase [Priestia taiwanensis]MBM7364124.1 dTDP-4-amino-4,6-dideoxygalactose transaminase [Priestia taiwanensis]GGE71755.1 spore coat protein [Priestia taiwanensis]